MVAMKKKSHHSPNEIRVFPRKRYIERRTMLNKVKTDSGCKDCGISGPPEVLTFDHVRGEKKFDVGPGWNQGLERLLVEIKKCEIVCANCHAIRTAKRRKERNGIQTIPKNPKIVKRRDSNRKNRRN